VANRACERAVPARQPGNDDCVLLARREDGVLRLEQQGDALTVVVQSSAGHGMARTVSDVRRRGRPMVRGGSAGQRVRAWRVAPTRTHPRRAQELERSARTDGHRPVSTSRVQWRNRRGEAGATSSGRPHSSTRHFDLALFDRPKLENWKPKCTQQPIRKL
jgi:hypothetical protein